MLFGIVSKGYEMTGLLDPSLEWLYMVSVSVDWVGFCSSYVAHISCYWVHVMEDATFKHALVLEILMPKAKGPLLSIFV